ncbi:hypothetical protein QEZ54_20830 [Catellatospora sp. KI3]|uniref:hypothetical protein n=1 Tax=Catellatospora sp. KI3 TaxID=3041620 RepID=UPI002482FE70|nr:hypothetical protein [Catellatospora sp. KI3]MDI1463430.1 hypothetical protein [Catellatospora sp. KI3]
MQPDLAAAIEELYAVFGRHPLAQRIDYCTHCVGEDEAMVLQRKRLRELAASDLELFSRKAMSTWGDEADFRHFLPRILELFATGELTHGYLFVKTMSNVRHYGTCWPADEVKAVEEYMITLWRRTLSEREPILRAAEILEGAAANDHSIAPYLAIWAEDTGEPAAMHLAEFMDELAWTYWQEDTLRRESRAWLHSGVPARILETAFLASGDPQAATWLGQALERLELLMDDAKEPDAPSLRPAHGHHVPLPY